MSDPREPQDGGGAPSPDDTQDDDLLDATLGDVEGEETPDDEPEEHEEQEAQTHDDEPPRRQTREERRQENWRREAIRLREEMAELRGRVSVPQAPQVDPRVQQQALEQEYERISMLSPTDQVREMHNLMRREAAGVAQLSAERADMAAFQALQREEPAARRLAPQVEQTIATLRAQGMGGGINREGIYNYLLGQEIRGRSREEGTRQRRNGAANVRRQTTRPANGRSNMAGSPGQRRGNQDAQDVALLRSIPAQEV